MIIVLCILWIWIFKEKLEHSLWHVQSKFSLNFVPLKKMIMRTDCRTYLKNQTKIEIEVSVVWEKIRSMRKGKLHEQLTCSSQPSQSLATLEPCWVLDGFWGSTLERCFLKSSSNIKDSSKSSIWWTVFFWMKERDSLFD